MRSVEGKLQQFPLSSGMDQSGGTRGSAPGTLEYAANLRVRGAGRLQRRCGSAGIAVTSLGGGAERSVSDSNARPRATEHPAFLASLGDANYVGTTAGDFWLYDGAHHQYAGSFSACRPVRCETALATANNAAPIVGAVPATARTATGYTLVATLTTTPELLWTIINPEGLVVYRGEGVTPVVAAVSWPRAVAMGDYLVLLYMTGSSVMAIEHNTTNGLVGVAATVMTLNSANACWDATPYNSTSYYVVGRTGATTTTVQEVLVGSTLGNTKTIASTGEIKLSIWGDATNAALWVGYLDDPSATVVAGFTALSVPITGAAIYGKTTILGSPDVDANSMPPLFGPRYAKTTSDVFFVLYCFLSTVHLARYGHIIGGSLYPSVPYTAHHVIPISKPDVQQRFWCLYDPIEPFTPGQFVLFRFSEPPDSTAAVLVVELCSAPDAGHAGLDPSGVGIVVYGSFHGVALDTESPGGIAAFALPICLTTISATSTQSYIVSAVLHEYERYNQSPRVDVTATNEIVIAGQPTVVTGLASPLGAITYGGVGAVELGFAATPRIFSSSQSAAPSGLPPGTYVYQAMFQWVDRLGRRHISPPSPPLTVTVTAPSTVSIVASDCDLGQRNVGIAEESATLLYRTVNGGSIPQLLPYAKMPTSTGQVTFTDNLQDADLAENEFIPTGGGVLPVRLAPSCRYVRAAEERLWCGGLWNREILEASRIRVPGEPYQFTADASHQVVLPAPCTGLAYQDGQVVAFTERAIYLVGGDGPNDQGAGSFLPPRAYVHGLGCSEDEEASILETELGIFFRSSASWWLIPRGFGSPTNLGDPVQDESAHCISSTVTETTDYRLARFLVGDPGDYSSDTVLVFDLMAQQWFRDTYTNQLGIIGAWRNGLALFRYSLASNAGAVATVLSYEDETLTVDNGSETITASFRTNWIYPFGSGGWGKVNKVQVAVEPLGTSQTLTMTVETDENTYSAPSAWTITNAAGAAYRELDMVVPYCTCYRVTVQQGPDGSPYPAGFRFLSLTAELEPDGGIRLLPTSERA